MNIFKKHKAAVLSLIAFIGCVVACDMITEIISLPEDAKVNSEVEIKARITLVPSSDDKTEFVFAMLTPQELEYLRQCQGDILHTRIQHPGRCGCR